MNALFGSASRPESGEARNLPLPEEAARLAEPLRILVATNMYPNPASPFLGIFVQQQVESLRAKGADVDVLFFNGPANKLNYLWGVPRFWAQLLRQKYHVIHAHYVYSGMIGRLQPRIPLVVTIHSGEVLQGRLEPWLTRRLVPRTDAVIAVSPEVQAAIGRSCRHVIPCGVDTTLFHPRPKDLCRAELGLPKDQRIVLFAAAPRPEKRLDLAEAAMRLLQDRLPDARLLVVSGETPDRVPLYMGAADVLLLTSDKEGSPQVVKEAMACNLPIVSVPVGDVREVLADVAGCYLSDRDPADIADKLMAVLKDPRPADGRARVEDSLSLPAIAERVLGVYRDVLGARGVFISAAPGAS